MTPRLLALLSWFDEPPELLTAAVEDAIRCGITDLIALDGRYRHYPGDSWTSSPEEYDAIRAVCEKRNIRYVIEHIEDATEVRKRTRLFEMAYEAGATREDWLFVTDADHKIARAQDLKPLLEDSEHDAFNVYGIEGDTGRFDRVEAGRWARLCFRAVPGLHVSPHSHWHYIDGEGRVLWGFNSVPADDLPIVVINRSTARTKQRNAGRDRYYQRRNSTDDIEAEYLPATCYDCDKPPIQRGITADWTVGEVPGGGYDFTHRRTLYCCAEHGEKRQKRETYRFERDLGRLIKTRPHVVEAMRDRLREKYPHAC